MASCIASQISIGLVETSKCSRCSESTFPRPDEESESTEWETDTDASDDEEGESEQARGALGQQRMLCCILASSKSRVFSCAPSISV